MVYVCVASILIRVRELCVLFGMDGCKIRYIDVMNRTMCGYEDVFRLKDEIAAIGD